MVNDMYPFIFIGDTVIRTQFILIITGIIIGFLILLNNINHLDKKIKLSILLFAVLIFIPFLTGGWLGYEIENFISNKNFCFSKESFFNSFSLLWGLGLATIFAFPTAKIFKLNVWSIADYFSISISAGGFFAKLGCLFNGCCFGIPAPDSFPFGIYYPFNSYPQSLFGDVRFYPSQLFESIAWLFILIFLIFKNKNKKFDGELIILMAFLFAIFRFLIEFTRFHLTKSFLSTGQILSIIIIFIAIITYYFRHIYQKSYKKLDKTPK
jgi:phosphatidylglycerol:prolipoprotein diacylglycerol transferase